MPTSARTIIKKAMQKVGVLVKSEVPDDDEANDALDSLNALIDSWSNNSANITSRVRETFTLSNNVSYTIGTGQTFNTARPMQLIEAFTTSGSIDYPMSIVNQEEYDLIALKDVGGRPTVITYNSGYPYGTITMFPKPDASYTLTILSEKAITGFATLDTTLNLPNGWERALVYNLALEIAPEYGQQPDGSIVKIASESLGAIKLAVIRSRPVNAYFSGNYSTNNIYGGYY
jgi:hypothetical protein